MPEACLHAAVTPELADEAQAATPLVSLKLIDMFSTCRALSHAFLSSCLKGLSELNCDPDKRYKPTDFGSVILRFVMTLQMIFQACGGAGLVVAHQTLILFWG